MNKNANLSLGISRGDTLTDQAEAVLRDSLMSGVFKPGQAITIRALSALLGISVTPAKDAVHAPAGTDEHRFAITATGSATLRGAGDDLTWAFNVIPDKPPTIELTKDPEPQRRGSLLLSYRLEDDYGVTEAQATFARKNDADADGESPHPLFGPPDFALILPQARTKAD